ncbi:hypothetical protein ACQKWADRAFT_300269 [Trichoderma austrokoningii]
MRWLREFLKHMRPIVIIHAIKYQIFQLETAEAVREYIGDRSLVNLEDCWHKIPHRARQ